MLGSGQHAPFIVVFVEYFRPHWDYDNDAEGEKRVTANEGCIFSTFVIFFNCSGLDFIAFQNTKKAKNIRVILFLVVDRSI